MPTLKYLDEAFDCTTAIKGDDYIHLLDDNGVMVAAFDAISDFSEFTLENGSYTSPTADHSCRVAIVRDDGTIGVGSHTCEDIGLGVNAAKNAYLKEEILADTTKVLYGLGTDAVPDDVFVKAHENIASGLPKIGDVKVTARKDLGEDWLLCNGASVSKELYPELHTLLTNYPFKAYKTVATFNSHSHSPPIIKAGDYFFICCSGGGASVLYSTSMEGPWMEKTLQNTTTSLENVGTVIHKDDGYYFIGVRSDNNIGYATIARCATIESEPVLSSVYNLGSSSYIGCVVSDGYVFILCHNSASGGYLYFYSPLESMFNGNWGSGSLTDGKHKGTPVTVNVAGEYVVVSGQYRYDSGSAYTYYPAWFYGKMTNPGSVLSNRTLNGNTSNSSVYVKSVKYFPELGRYYAVANTVDGNQVVLTLGSITSVTDTTTLHGFGTLYDIEYADGLFYLLTSSGIYTSPTIGSSVNDWEKGGPTQTNTNALHPRILQKIDGVVYLINLTNSGSIAYRAVVRHDTVLPTINYDHAYAYIKAKDSV